MTTWTCTRTFLGLAMSVLLVLGFATDANAVIVTVDFEGHANGEEITGGDLGGLVSDVTTTSDLNLAAIFDSSDPGPNDSGGDPDLLVNLGNILIIQNNAFSTQSVADIFDTPNDDEDGGMIKFTFSLPVALLSIDLVDINGGAATDVEIMDTNGLTRTYSVPEHWTGEPGIPAGNLGWGTLLLTVLSNQTGPGSAAVDATASEQAGFDETMATMLKVTFDGSAGLDNIVFDAVPEPAGVFVWSFLVVCGLLIGCRRARANG